MLSPQAKRTIYRIIPFGLFWLFFSILYILMEKGLLGDAQYYPSTGNPYDFTSNLVITASIATVTGLLFGTIDSWLIWKMKRKLKTALQAIV